MNAGTNLEALVRAQRDTAFVALTDEEMVRILRRGYAAYSRGDFDAAAELAHPDIMFVPPGGQAPLIGVEAFRQWMQPDALVNVRIEPVAFSVNGERVLVRQRTQARGATSGIELDLETLVVWTLNDDGLAMRVESFLVHEEDAAAQAAGLAE